MNTSISTNEETTARSIGYFTMVLGFAVLTLSFLSSCNTTRGFGRDVAKAGNHIERRAAQVQNY